MQIINNSSTKYFCKDCTHTSIRACKNGLGDNILPCYILRKIANKCTSIYNECYWNEDNLIPDFYNRVTSWCCFGGVKYLDDLRIKKELIMLAISFVINSHTGNDLDFINEFSDDIDLNNIDRNRVIKLYKAIFEMQTEINNEWFSKPGNKKNYLKQVKEIMNS